MRLAAHEDYLVDETRLCFWYPKDYVYENKKGGELEARLESKGVKLLGEPISCDWK